MSEKRAKQYRRVKARTMSALIRRGLRGNKLAREMSKLFPRRTKFSLMRRRGDDF